MANILSRFSDIMAANINALLDRAEDPELMIDQYLRNLQSDLGNVKAETASVMAEESRCRRVVEETAAEANRMNEYAKRALTAGNEDDAKQFLARKATLDAKLAVDEKAYAVAQANTVKMRSLHDKLTADIGELEARKNEIKAKIKLAKTQEKVQALGGSAAGVKDTMSAFAAMEEKANRMLDEAEARAELDAAPTDDIVALTEKYDAQEESPAVDDALQKLKEEMGIE